MEEDEWLAGYKNVTGYGFVGLEASKLGSDSGEGEGQLETRA